MVAVFIMMTEYLNITVGSKEWTARILTVITALLTFMLFFFHAGYGLDGKWLLVLPVMTALIYTAILFSKESDVGAYLFGMAFGQKHGHKLFPSISPKKSWEGYFGGLALSLAAGWCTGYFHLIDFPWYHCLILALLVNISSTIGDLVESQLKRNFGVKDAGRIMPGHGGLLDRFDGALLAFPVSVLYITLSGL